MKRTAVTLCALAFVGLLTVAQAQEKASPAGTWKWQETGRNNNPRDVTGKFKVDGEKLTGTISGRQNDTEISDGKFKDGEVSFTVTRERQGQKFVTKYSGKLDKDSIKGKIERDGQVEKVDWEAKREKA